MKTEIIIALSILSVNSYDGVSQGFDNKSGNTNASIHINSHHATNWSSGNGFSGIFNSVYFPGTFDGSPVKKAQSCASIFTGKYEVAENQSGVISERAQILRDSTQASFSMSKKGYVRNNGMKRKGKAKVQGEEIAIR